MRVSDLIFCLLVAFWFLSCAPDKGGAEHLGPSQFRVIGNPRNHGLLPLLDYPHAGNQVLYVTKGLDSLMFYDFQNGEARLESTVDVFFDYWGVVDDRLILQEGIDSGLVYSRSRPLDLSVFEKRTIPDVLELDGVRYLCSYNSRVQKIRSVDSNSVIVPLSTTRYSYWEPAYFRSPCLALLDWQTNEVESLDISYPSIYHEQCNGGLLTTYPVVNGSTIVVAYPASTELFVYDLGANRGEFVDVQPINFDFEVNPYDTAYKDDMNFAINYMMTETQVVGFEYHSEFNCYIRFIDYHTVDDSGLNELRGASYLQLLSDEFDLIGEYRLPIGVVPVHHHLCRHGFRMSLPDSVSRANNVSRYAEFDLRPLLR